MSHEQPFVGKHPATRGQQQIWFSDQLAPGATFNTVPVHVEITGALDTGALTAALMAVVHRHEPLRTTYRLDGTELVAVVAPDPQVTINAWDLRELLPAERTARAEALVANELARPIDISSGAPLRAVLLRLDDDSHQLVLLVHHIAVDGASVAVIQEELVRSYAGQVALPQPGVRYRDVALLSGDADVEHWCAELADLPEPLELPNLRTRPAQPDFAAEVLPLVVPEELANAVRKTASTHRSSSFMVLLTAFSVLLHRLTGSSDIVVGSPSAGREHADTHDLVGYFVNMLALRVRLGWDPTCAEAMDLVRDTVLDALDHREAPFHQIVEALGEKGDVDRHPVFQVVFASPPPLAGPLAAGGCVFTFTQGTSNQCLYDLELQLPDSGSGELRGWAKFRTALYQRADIVDLTERFTTVLEQLTSTPDARLSNLSLLSADETLRIVRDLNANATAYPADATLVELFEQTADRFSEDIAVEFGSVSLTYAELDQRANRLAAHLGALGVGVGTPVGILLERGVDWIVAAIAVLKAGGAYLPLDPEYPIERLQALCADASAAVVVAGRPADLGVELVDLSATVLTCPADRPQRTVEPDDLAYVMYTSGSTGMPKGVCVSHRNVVRLVRDTNYVEFAPGDRVAHASTTTFDAATFEIWGALLNGARLVGLPKDIALDPAALGEWLRANSIDTLFLTTSVAMHVARELPAALSSLRYFVFGGEQPDEHAVATLVAHPGGPEHVVNGYGPTETTTFASSHSCDRSEGRIPLGRALSNTQLYVLDQYLEPVPPMVAGELCIGGDGVGRGYVGNPALTAERFVPDHVGGRPGARLYRTGDLARLLPDGTFEYLGRADRQVKIRGFRIEPGEVEACLHSSGLVRQAVVVPREDAAGDVSLVGYVVLEQQGDEQLDELMRHVRDALPAYLVPSALVPMETLPLTRNGKLDLRALPDPEIAAEEPDEPQTVTEVAVADLWRQVLGAESVGRDANFFDLGGHSLKAARILSRIESELGVRLPMRSLFDHPTVAGIATEVDRLRDTTPVSVGAIRAEARSSLSVADLLDL
ncbi:amino acid adenylation domain-containing protein [Lentzea atacamensis]|uniref:Amino acid adenylation domain-containing protein n=1 Tax=Lentzea atacamensis TaxID=531938 RepID=A0A316HWE8_9PSEU|nr:non-ribosomal peptide synthetase [Lentzea atacamensis]PWK84984.1 amino acid adenylation domain-containing protein [Lentzea atacamensis]